MGSKKAKKNYHGMVHKLFHQYTSAEESCRQIM